MKIKNVIIIVVILAALVSIKFILLPSQTSSKSIGQPVKVPVVNVTAYVIKPEKLENTISASGTIVANEEVELKPEISGKIISLPLKEGTGVSKNQLLVKLDDSDFQAQLKKSQLQFDLADKQLKRQQELLKINGISQQDFDVALNNVSSIKADMEYIQSQISKTEIKAPFNGIIGLKRISEGSYISTGTTIASIFEIDPLKIDFSVGEHYSSYIKKGVKVLFNIDGVKGTIEGEVYAVEPKIDMETRTMQVRAICPNKNQSVFPGAFAHISVQLKDIENAVMIPTEAVVPEIRGKKVFVIKNGKAQSVAVETGVRTSSKVQVLSGLQGGDTVVTTGVMQLKPDVLVKITQIN